MKITKPFQFLKPNHGMSILEVIVSLGLLGLIAITSLQLWKSNIANKQSATANLDQSAVGQFIMNAVSCNKTVEQNQTACGQGTAVSLFTADGRVIVAAPSGQVGNVEVRATCTGNSIFPEFRASSQSAWKPVFGGGVPIACRECDLPSGVARSSYTIRGEDVPGNGLFGGGDWSNAIAFGGDYDDYALTISGDLLIDGILPTNRRIAVSKKGTVTVSYARGTTACSHNFTFNMKRCAKENSNVIPGSQSTLSIGSGNFGSTTVNVPEDGVYFDVVMRVSSSFRTDFGGCIIPGFITNRLYGTGSFPFPSFYGL